MEDNVKDPNQKSLEQVIDEMKNYSNEPINKFTGSRFYNCKQNDAIIEIKIKDGKAYELLFKIDGEKESIVIGHGDLMNALMLV